MVLLTPAIGQWYVNKSGTAFEVVAIDNDSNAIDIQLVDGTVDELDDERWADTVVEEIEAPNDCIVSVTHSDRRDTIQNDFVPRSEWLDTLDFMDIEYVEMEQDVDGDKNGGHL
ncbi:MAG: DUF6763 family protein [Gammaproteobacteria bacterium]